MRNRLRRWWIGPVGLRRRILLTISLGAVALSAFLAFSTYGLVRASIVNQRDQAALDASRLNALTVERELRSSTATDPTAQLSLSVQRYLLFYRNQFWNGVPPFDQLNLPDDLRALVVDDGTPARQIVRLDDELFLVVGWSVPGVGAYFEYFSLDEADGTLRSVRIALFAAAAVTAAFGLLLGLFASRRAVRPLSTAAQAASAISTGRLDYRLEPSEDPDLRTLIDSFNDMAQTLQLRIERDARFASDVSHELRSPLMTLSASVEVMQARRDDIPERAQAALDLLASDVVRFQGLVEDLLEISRYDAGAIRLNLEELLAVEFVQQAVGRSSMPETTVDADERAERCVLRADRRRLAQVIVNLLNNARAYGGGSAEVVMRVVDDTAEPISRLRIAVQDHGPGVDEDERELVFERFARGGGAGRRTGSEGAGLGLSLVDEHVRMHGGRVWVEDRLDGESGARFVVELMAFDIDRVDDESEHDDEDALDAAT